ncbi:MAG: hypothetical protein GY755_21970 [Chloroflexi bacterium]|nr:hypothetical protein [Desulfobacteraceae bacterium]MCP4142920.1 hypothetical protein [Chloroflexota bacterium]
MSKKKLQPVLFFSACPVTQLFQPRTERAVKEKSQTAFCSLSRKEGLLSLKYARLLMLGFVPQLNLHHSQYSKNKEGG